MIKFQLKPIDQIELTDIVDYTTDELVGKGTENVIYADDLLTAPDNTYVLYSIDKFPDEYYKEIFVISGDKLVPVHESWIEFVIDEAGEKHIINHSKPWLTSTLIKLNTKHKFLNIDTLEIIFNDACCSFCGAALETTTEFGICETCENELLKVHSYSYKPEPKFHGNSPVGKFYGIELEYGFQTEKNALKVMAPHSHSLYLKDDRSIKGGKFQAELVSHPHTFEELMQPTSFIHTVANCKVQDHEANGCHIHISRSSFKDQKHYALFYFLTYSSQDFLEFIGGRQLNSYCRYNPIGKIFNKENTPNSADRATVINERNTNTIEVRIFKSTNKTAEIKKYIQFIDSLIEYTRQAKKSVSLGKYFKYIKANQSTYDVLAKALDEYKGSLANPVVYRAPIIKDLKVSNLALIDFPNITAVMTSAGTIKVDLESTDVFIRNGSTLEFSGIPEEDSNGSRRSYSINLNEIRGIRVVK